MNKSLDDHMDLLKEKVFQTQNKWPHFELLLNDIKELSQQAKSDSKIVSLERALLYGGYSLIAPFFQNADFCSVDCSPQSANERGAYNASMVDDKRFIAIPTTHRGDECNTNLDDDSADLVIVPNLVHHIKDQDKLFSEMARITKPGGEIYVFEPLIRELHQIPDDYIRYTPYGMSDTMKKHGFEPYAPKLEGNVFSVIAYCWTQALQYFPQDSRKEMEDWFNNQHYPQLMQWDTEHPKNLVRDHTKFPMSFSVSARKI